MSSYLQSLQNQNGSKVVYEYKVPQKAGRGEITSVGLVELTASQEIEATSSSRTDTSKMAFELAKRSLVEVNGEKFPDLVTAERVWNRMPAKVRQLVMNAYVEIHNPQEEDTADFLASRVAKVE